MKHAVPVLLAALVGVCGIPYVYGFRKAFSENPFIYAACFNLCAGAVLLVIALSFGGIENGYLARNWRPIVLAAVGIIGVNILAYFIVNEHGAGYWMLASLANVIIGPAVVGYLVLKEKCNWWIVPAYLCAILTVMFFQMSRRGGAATDCGTCPVPESRSKVSSGSG